MKTTALLQNAEDKSIFGRGAMDIVYDAGGRVVELTGAEKLQMLVLKALLTGAYSNEDGEIYGSTLKRLTGIRATGGLLIGAIVAKAATNAIRAYKLTQSEDLDPSERLARVATSPQVSRYPDDPSVLKLSVSIQSGDGTIIPISHVFKTY